MKQPPIDDNWQALPTNLLQEHNESPLTRKQVRARALVLAARMIPHTVDQSTGTQRLLVPPEYYREALRQLQQHNNENLNWPPRPTEEPEKPGNYLATLTVLGIFILFNSMTLMEVTFTGQQQTHWALLGNAHSDLILKGEWWRAITALTLHADFVHLFGNVVIGGVYMLWLCREFGGGLGWLLCLGAGGSGNLLNAWLQQPAHRSIGASTAVFGILGIVASYNFLRHRHRLGRRQLAPLAAAFCLLALLGTGDETTDIGAHLFGFGSGLILGLIASKVLKRYKRPNKLLNGILSLFGFFCVIFSWIKALN